MVLQSQAPREGMGRRYVVSSRRRKRSIWPWLVIGGAAAVVLFIIFAPLGGDESDEADNSAGENNVQTPEPTSVSPRVSPVAEQQDRNRLTQRPRETPEPSPLPAQVIPPQKPHNRQEEPIARPPEVTPPSIAAAPPAHTPVDPGPPASSASGPAAERFTRAVQWRQAGRLIDARSELNALLFDLGDKLSYAEQQTVRDLIAELNDELIFSPTVYANDPLVEVYTVQSGDRLSKVAPRYKTTYQLIERINKINANRVRVGQKLKVLKGPVHAQVSKSQFRLDLFVQDADGEPVYLTSFPVGLGEQSSTPVGPFKVSDKVENPAWTNPKTNQTYARGDPNNPIGKHWIRLVGANESTRGFHGYGVHGTIEPQSIGQEASMGCVRMLADDVHRVYDMLVAGQSTVEIAR